MNEQFKTLFDKVNLPYVEGDSAYTVTGSDLQMFAELIVKECAEVGLDSVEDGDDLDAIMKRVHNNILKHFGVEE